MHVFHSWKVESSNLVGIDEDAGRHLIGDSCGLVTKTKTKDADRHLVVNSTLLG